MALIGYGRVSTLDQHPEAQQDLLVDAGCEPVFIDAGASGKLASRPKLDACLAFLRRGDVLVITKLDRLGRSVKNLIELVERLKEMGVDLRVLQQGIDTTSPTGKLLFHILAAIAEFERDLIIDRTKDGLAAARARGRTGGRPPALSPEKAVAAREMIEAGGRTMAQIAEIVGCSRATLYRVFGGRAS
ncbi:MAG TPA: recombinase family protein [Mycobacterium sp.]|nr:recombinase family protein [Mycobacterium sp.]